MAASHSITSNPPPRMKNRKIPLPRESKMIEEASRIYRYDHDNGGLIWIRPVSPGRQGQAKIGFRVGGDDGNGYLMCMLLGHKFKIHQIVWMILHKHFPASPIDHINRDKRDNRIENLRLVTDKQNGQNRKTTTSEFAGVSSVANRTGYASRITHNGKKIYLGYFKTKEEARDAYIIASREIRGDYSAV